MDKDFRFKKKFGQNFLKNNGIVKRIVEVSGVDDKSLVIEVGPGAGALTKELASCAAYVIAYEVDTTLEETLNDTLSSFNNIEIKFGDFLDSDILNDISKYDYESIYFVSNVPYYITTPILMKLMDSKIHFKNIVMMVQKEVGDRFSTTPGNKEYGSITVLLNYFYNIKREFKVSRKEFIPEPNVDSVIVSFREKEDKLPLKYFNIFQKLIRDSFQFKRKTLRNNLKNYPLDKVSNVLESYGYDLNVRAESLSVDIFVSIANELV